jgi:hypothetical protein
MAPQVRFDRAQTPFGRVGPACAADLLPESVHVGSQRLTLTLGMAAEQQSQSAAAGAAHLLLYAIELAFQAGATGAGSHLPKLAGFMLELPTDTRIRLSRARANDNGGESPNRGGKNRVLLHCAAFTSSQAPFATCEVNAGPSKWFETDVNCLYAQSVIRRNVRSKTPPGRLSISPCVS